MKGPDTNAIHNDIDLETIIEAAGESDIIDAKAPMKWDGIG